MPFCDPKRGFDTRDKILALINFGPGKPSFNKELIGWLYSSLSILDSKANGLLRVNAFFLTLLAATLALFEFISRPDPNIDLPEIFGFGPNAYVPIFSLPFLISSVICIMVVRVSWRVLGKVTLEEAKQNQFSKEINALSHAVNDRTFLYQSAWWLSLAGIGLLVVAIVLEVAGIS